MSERAENDDRTAGPVTMDTLEDLDFDIIQDMPWAESLWQKIQRDTKKGFLNWCSIVRKLVGTNPEHVKEWSQLYEQTIGDTTCDMIYDLLLLQEKTMDKIQNLLKQLEKVCLELNQGMPEKIGADGLSLFEEQHQLKKQIAVYETIITNKKKELDKLHEKQRRLCKHLGEEPKFTVQYPPLPTPAQLEDFQKYIDQLESEKFEREEKYCLLKHDITILMDELKYKPTSDFERKILTSDDFLVTEDNLKKLVFCFNNLKDIKKSTEEEISQLRGRIEDLWKMLDVDLIDRDEFRSHYTGNSIDTLDALRVEVKRCEEIRKANMKMFVDKLRVQLQDLWKKCHCTDSVRRSFKYFNSDCYTEDLLDLHEMEIQKWKHYYGENAKLLGLLEKHQELWEKVIEFEENATGPDRYKNRGGKLLQEEKERNKLSKIIPKIEEEIKALSEEYRNNNNGVSFISFGKTPEEYIEHLHAERENVKKLKLSSRKLQRDITVGHTPAKSAINLFPSTSTAVTPTPSSTIKRKILGTPNTENIKRLRANTPKSVPKPCSTPSSIVPRIKVTHATLTLPRQKRRSRTSMERHKRLDDIRRKSKKSQSFDKDAPQERDTTRNTTYTDFQTELSSREQCRSTILPEIILTTPAASSCRRKIPKKKTPFRTPLNYPAITPTRPTPSSAYKTPSSRTPASAGKGNKDLTQLSTCRSNLNLLF